MFSHFVYCYNGNNNNKNIQYTILTTKNVSTDFLQSYDKAYYSAAYTLLSLCLCGYNAGDYYVCEM